MGGKNNNTLHSKTKNRRNKHNQCNDCHYLPVSLCPPDSRLESALLVPWLLCPCLRLELQSEISLSLEPVPERFFLTWAFCLSWTTSPASLELSMLWRLLFLQLCAFTCCNRKTDETGENQLHSLQKPQKHHNDIIMTSSSPLTLWREPLFSQE